MLREQKQKNGNIVPIIMGDWNDTPFKTDLFADLNQEFGLTDIFKARFPDHREFKTFIDGQRRIDYVLSLPWVANAVETFVYEPFMYRMTRDHRGFYFDIDERTLFRDAQEDIYDFTDRVLKSKDKKSAKTYIDSLYTHLKSNNVAD